jgi:hypothetical protein
MTSDSSKKELPSEILPSSLNCNAANIQQCPGVKVWLNITKMFAQISQKHKFAVDSVFRAELNELSSASSLKEGYYVTPVRTENIILATHTQEAVGEKGRDSELFPSHPKQ